jgi:hypothetical protein
MVRGVRDERDDEVVQDGRGGGVARSRRPRHRVPLDELARRSHAFIERSPEHLPDLEGVTGLPDTHAPRADEWLAYWRKNPIAAWTGNGGWFAVDGQRFVPCFQVPPGLEATVAAMTSELVDYRLARYRSRVVDPSGDTFSCNVSWTSATRS